MGIFERDVEETIVQRSTLTIDGHSYELAQSTQLSVLKAAAEDAVQSGGRFVDVTIVGNVAVSILISPGVPIFIATLEVVNDDRDTGDLAEPFDTTEWEIGRLFGG
ncbi:hypothetical protein [Plantibacter sp. YIM 135347]|uniref:hypothetical protein n=1 Tax=Plantibacter sp. YIM 135347 TaxID=3423919 RepID=UPI003D333505